MYSCLWQSSPHFGEKILIPPISTVYSACFLLVLCLISALIFLRGMLEKRKFPLILFLIVLTTIHCSCTAVVAPCCFTSHCNCCRIVHVVSKGGTVDTLRYMLLLYRRQATTELRFWIFSIVHDNNLCH